MKEYDVLVIGGGPAGLAAAISAREHGIENILILERDQELGGILNQCIHNGFGLHTFKEELTGPEYAARFIRRARELQIPYQLHTMVADICSVEKSTAGSCIGEESTEGTCSEVTNSVDSCLGRTGAAGSCSEEMNAAGSCAAETGSADICPGEASAADGCTDESAGGYIVTAISRQEGLQQLKTKAVILAMGCRERPRGALNIPGYRPAGIFSAGTAQRLVNIEGFMPGKEVVILGSGDIGLIMARRMTLEGAKVKVVAELMPYSGGLKRNIVQCLDDFGIPLKLSHTVVDIDGKERAQGVTIAEVGADGKPIAGTEEYISCDTLLLSVGLLPENELSRAAGVRMNPVTNGPVVNESLETNLPGIFACGNVLHVHDLVDYVSEEAASAGKYAAKYILEKTAESKADSSADPVSNDGAGVAAAYGSAGSVSNDGADAAETYGSAGFVLNAGAGAVMAGSGVAAVGAGAAVDEFDGAAENPAAGAAGSKESAGVKTAGQEILLLARGGVRYTVPSSIHPERMEDSLTVRFRVGNVFKNAYVCMYFGDQCVARRKKQVLAPGEMENITIRKKDLENYPQIETITLQIEEAQAAQSQTRQEQAAQSQTRQEQAVQSQTRQEQAVQEQTGQKQAMQEQIGRGQAVQEQAAQTRMTE